MKRVLFSSLFCIGMIGFANAQSVNGNSSTTTGSVSTPAKSAKTSKGKAAKPSRKLNNRKIYHFSNGQRSTPTGAEATPSSGGGYAALGKDTTAKPVSPARPAKKSSVVRSN